MPTITIELSSLYSQGDNPYLSVWLKANPWVIQWVNQDGQDWGAGWAKMCGINVVHLIGIPLSKLLNLKM